MSGQLDQDGAGADRRCRRAFTYPIALFAGVLYGAAGAGAWDVPGALAAVLGGGAFLLVLHSAERLEPLVRGLLSGGAQAGSTLTLLVRDTAVGAAFGALTAAAAHTQAWSSMAAGAAGWAAYSFLLGEIFCGGAIDAAVGFLLSGGAGRARSDYSAADALAGRGQTEAALVAYAAAAERRPAEPEPYLRAAMLLRRRGNFGEAVGWYRRALRRAHLGPGTEAMVLRSIAELCIERLHEPAAARPELDRLAERFGGTAEGRWALGVLREGEGEGEGEGG